ncbi:MAG: flagellar protein FlgN [Treponema sp.]|nr:flagellar protein FlgN [Treponema sp.]
MMEITEQELEERIAIIRKFKLLLEKQRSKFKDYLTVLEKQQDSISEENTENLLIHTELETEIVKNIQNLQKVIVPMSKLYNSSSLDTKEDDSIKNIKDELDDLQDKVLKQNEINRNLLRIHIDQIRTNIQNFKNPYKNASSVYAQKREVATLIQVEA